MQMRMAIRRADILIIGCSSAGFYALADKAFCLQLGKIPINGAETDLLFVQRLGDLLHREQLIRVLFQKVDQRSRWRVS